MYQYDQLPETKFTEQAETFMKRIRTRENTILCGKNNCGKSYILKCLAQQDGALALYLGPSRYHNFHALGSFDPSTFIHKQVAHKEHIKNLQNQQHNIDN